ncbi:hypothetical protein [Desulfitobacterium hafniense]|uniref:Uncharacterized protein n=1 Tax=Desulfitobacterium hafniense (strain Y51) TaxID=138119 RepID=Q24ZD8_DESHY|nr:hypothetical protein [Desulfitobacterium hafniense]BAE82604.1 hypothetical protein DSY0815 [Desulfitobacterium hafniense Y51]
MFNKNSEPSLIKRAYRAIREWSHAKKGTVDHIYKTYSNNRNSLWMLGFVIGIIWLIKQNWAFITNYEIIDQQGLLVAIQTPANLFVFKIGIVYALATIIYFLLRLPYQKIRSLKIGSSGIEYTTVEEKARVADESFERLRTQENARLNILKTLVTPQISAKIRELVSQNEINMTGGVSLISSVMKATLLSTVFCKTFLKKVAS